MGGVMAPESLDAYRERVRAWLSEHVPHRTPHEPYLEWHPAAVDRDRAIQRTLWAGRVTGPSVPVEYGGLGLTAEHEDVLREEAATYRMPEVFGNAFNIVIPTLLTHANEQLKREHIPSILNGDHIWCQLLSEPSGGSDLAGLLTRAERDGDNWRIHGAKIWTTGGNYSDYGICLARTDSTVSKHAGLTMFVVRMASPGMQIRPLVLTDGTQYFCQEFLDDVVVPHDQVIGEVNDGWRVARTVMRNERTAIGRGWHLGSHQGGTDDRLAVDRGLLNLAAERGIEGDSHVRTLIGESWTLSIVQALLVKRVTAAMRAGAMPPTAAALLKGMSGLADIRRGEIGTQVAGPRAVAWTPEEGNVWGMNRLWSHGIGGGTTEMQLNAVAERVLGLPKEPCDDRDVPFNQLRKNTVPRPFGPSADTGPGPTAAIGAPAAVRP
jgi:alkylation response protein AidB-like acyl-CoA dehydrogenase